MVRVSDEFASGDAWRLLDLFARLEKAQRRAEAGSELRAADRRLMWLLADGQARTVRQMADQLGLERSTVTRQVAAAITEGLMVRIETRADGAHPFTATPEGRRLLRSDLARYEKFYDAALSALPAGESLRFLDLFSAMVDAYGALVERDVGSQS